VIGANIAITAITFASHWYDYLLQMMLPRILSILLHGILIFISCKYPLKLVQIHGPLVVLFQLPMILWATGHTSLPLNAMPASIAGLNNLMIYSIICNANWMVTTGFLALSLAGSFVYYSLMYNYLDYITISLVSSTMLFVVYAIYQSELRDKSELIGLAEIRRMNAELKDIFMGLPEGIVLIAERSGQVVLNNEEFMKIFQIPSDARGEEVG
jgi:hypothetical protein